MDYCEALGQLINNFRAAKASGAIPADTIYRPHIERAMSCVRVLSCRDAEGKQLEAVPTVRLELDLNERKRQNEDEGLSRMMAEQIKDIEAQDRRKASLATDTEPLLWATWGECAHDVFLVVALAAIIFLIWQIDWNVFWNDQLSWAYQRNFFSQLFR